MFLPLFIQKNFYSILKYSIVLKNIKTQSNTLQFIYLCFILKRNGGYQNV